MIIEERTKICDCGNEKNKWNQRCEDCQNKKDKKEIKEIVIGLVVAIFVLSLLFATIVEFQTEIGAFFTTIENYSIDFYNSLSSFFQHFLQALGVITLALSTLAFMAFVLVTAHD